MSRPTSLLSMLGVGFLDPVVRLARGESPRAQLIQLWQLLGVPLIAVALFLFLWGRLSAGIETSLGRIPGPAAVWQQAQSLWADHKAERVKAEAFYARQDARNAARLKADPSVEITP